MSGLLGQLLHLMALALEGSCSSQVKAGARSSGPPSRVSFKFETADSGDEADRCTRLCAVSLEPGRGVITHCLTYHYSGDKGVAAGLLLQVPTSLLLFSLLRPFLMLLC